MPSRANPAAAPLSRIGAAYRHGNGRSRVMGCIFSRGKKGYYSIAYYRNGKRYVESTGSASYENAKTLLRRREGDIARGIPVTPAVGKLRFEQARDDLLNYQRVNRRPGI